MKWVFAYILLTTGAFLTAKQESVLEKKPRIATTQGFTQEWIQIIAEDTVTIELLEAKKTPAHPPAIIIETGLEKEDQKIAVDAPRIVLSDGLQLLKEGQALQPKACKRITKKDGVTACCCACSTPSPRYEAVFTPTLENAPTHLHAWMDVSLAASMVVSLTETLCDLAPEHAMQYKSRSEAYQKELESLDLEIFTFVNKLPQDALDEPNHGWLYFTRRYGLKPSTPETKPMESELPPKGTSYIETIHQYLDVLKNKRLET